MVLFIVAVIVFIIVDLIIRFIGKKLKEKKLLKEREESLKVSLNLDFSSEANTLKRAEVKNPKAKILCVDDEAVILDSFRKILVLDGYSVDTVESGKEALGLIQKKSYDFLYTDLKMPEMNGIDVTKSAKHFRPDIDVVIITGYATVESAVECMKFGAMDYVQKPFTEDELLDFTKKSLIKREDRISKTLKPKVLITQFKDTNETKKAEFIIPGGIFISEGHCWININEKGTVKIGIDDFAKKIIGKIENIDLPKVGSGVNKGQPLFIVNQGKRTITFNSPVSGNVKEINKLLNSDIKSMEKTSYKDNWICEVDAEDIDSEIPNLKIGKAAVNFYEAEIENLQEIKNKIESGEEEKFKDQLYLGEMENLDDVNWKKYTEKFFDK